MLIRLHISFRDMAPIQNSVVVFCVIAFACEGVLCLNSGIIALYVSIKNIQLAFLVTFRL